QLATENERRYQRFGKRLKPEERKQAIFAFKGSVYQGLDVSDFTEEDLAFAQDHLRILSGLYGLLRPLDKIQAYRLEMGTKLENPAGKNLYDYWDQSITEKLNSDLPKGEEKVLLNLASQEYFKAVKPAAFKGKIIHINFKEERDGKYKIISFNAKVARGLMARYIIKNKITKSSDIKAFSEDNYLFNDKLSDEFNWIFTR
ncbi:MAG: peroxide stress protein YaaA, partial [Saprospiraceae bacterium]|nr:peroxide stress protein YaaA [Saprospiraceae bacterium]